jgi:hypothetical protein
MAVELIDDLPDDHASDFKYKEDVVKNSCAAAYIGAFYWKSPAVLLA